MKFEEIKTYFLTTLSGLYEVNEVQEIFLLTLEYQLGINRSSYILIKGNDLKREELQALQEVLNQLLLGKPIHYILGRTMFFGLPFNLSDSVLIPRPETEELVDWVLDKLKSTRFHTGFNKEIGSPNTLHLLDIGTGSGCIAITLKKKLPTVSVTALDLSSKALDVAKKNALINEVDVEFVEADILKLQNTLANKHYEIIISNPPYITAEEKKQMHKNVLAFEPHIALFVEDKNPLLFYEAIAEFGLKNLSEKGLIFFEINENLGQEMIEMLTKKGFNTIELRKDINGKDRMICCSK